MKPKYQRPPLLRLKPSTIEGVGVFTDYAIRKGADLEGALFAKDDFRFWKRGQTTARERKLLKRYAAIITPEGFHGPKNLNQMSIGWYLNHSKTPNVGHINWFYIALRDIKPGEELVMDYDTLVIEA